jgi:hypothetical protein
MSEASSFIVVTFASREIVETSIDIVIRSGDQSEVGFRSTVDLEGLTLESSKLRISSYSW